MIDEGLVDLHVTWNGVDVSGAPVYLFTDTGTYLNRSVTTGPQGHAQFQVPVKAYKFRIDYNSRQYWTSVITPIAHQSLPVEVPLEQLALMPTNNPLCKRMDHSKEPEILAFGVRKLAFKGQGRNEQPVVHHGDLSPLPQSSIVNRQSSIPSQGIRVASLGSLMGILSQAVVAQVAPPKAYYFLNDHLGTPLLITDQTNKVVWEGRYDPFGECIVHPFSTIENNFRFPGQYYDSESGLHYNYYRYYLSRTGRYVAPDPIGQVGGFNLYGYVAGNPITLLDPFGLVDLNLFAPGDPAFQGAASAPSPPNTFTVGGHGNPVSMLDQQGNPLTPKQLADLIRSQPIRSDPAYHPGTRIQLMSCNTGVDPCQGTQTYAQQLANELREEVLGAENFVWFYPSGSSVVAPTNMPGVTWQNYTPAAGQTGPNLSFPGGYRLFSPQN